MTQNDALTILKTGANVFLTGPAGSGKTYVLNSYIDYLKRYNVPVGVTASTGIAATHLSGITIHSWSGIGIKDRLDGADLDEIMEKDAVVRRIKEAQVLIIDEVSMLHHYRLDMIDSVLRKVKRLDLPFGGMQMVLCGDFFQLPPVTSSYESKARFIFESESWKAGDFTVCYLEGSYRHGEDSIVGILNEMRTGNVSQETVKRLRARIVTDDGEFNDTRLYTHNIDVDSLNDEELERMDGTTVTYEMTSKGKRGLVQSLIKSCMAPEKLRLKNGARVMCVKNNFNEGYVNGTLGVVFSCAHGADPVIVTAPSKDYPNGRKITVKKDVWLIDDGHKILAEVEQYPLRLAWAVTIHKSQGMSLDRALVDLTNAFEPGMGYVALSRVRTIDGLTLLGLGQHALIVNRDAMSYDKQLREMSEKSERMLKYTDTSDINKKQESFTRKFAPKHDVSKNIAKQNTKKKRHGPVSEKRLRKKRKIPF